MTLKQQLKPLSEVSLEDAKAIIGIKKGDINAHLWKLSTDEKETIPNKTIRNRYSTSEYTFYDDRISKSIFYDDMTAFETVGMAVELDCHLRASQFGYYVPKLSEALKIKELEGRLSSYREVCTGSISPVALHGAIARIEKQIAELKI